MGWIRDDMQFDRRACVVKIGHRDLNEFKAIASVLQELGQKREADSATALEGVIRILLTDIEPRLASCEINCMNYSATDCAWMIAISGGILPPVQPGESLPVIGIRSLQTEIGPVLQ